MAKTVARPGRESRRLRRALDTADELTLVPPTDDVEAQGQWPRSRDVNAPKPPNITRAWIEEIERENAGREPDGVAERSGVLDARELARCHVSK